MLKPWNGWKALAKRYLRMYSWLVAKYSPYVLAVLDHLVEGVHLVGLPELPLLAQVRPALVVEPAVAVAGDDKDAVVGEDALVADDLGDAVAVVEVGGHAHDHDVVLLLGPVHVGALVGELPGDGLHLGGVAGEDGDLAAPGVEHGVAAEELLAHLLFHEHALLVELVAHQGGGGDGDEVRAAHDARHVVGADGAPVGDAGGTVLVAARVAAVGVALRVADEDGDVGVVDVLVHDHVVALRGEAEVDEVVVVLGVVARDLAGALELVVEVVA